MKAGRGETPGGRLSVDDGIEPDDTGRTPDGPAKPGLPGARGIGPEAGLCTRPGRGATVAGRGPGLGAGRTAEIGRGATDVVASDWGRFDTNGEGRLTGGLGADDMGLGRGFAIAGPGTAVTLGEEPGGRIL